MEHEFPKEFKPVNIESYDGTTDPVVWIEDLLLHIHMFKPFWEFVLHYFINDAEGVCGASISGQVAM